MFPKVHSAGRLRACLLALLLTVFATSHSHSMAAASPDTCAAASSASDSDSASAACSAGTDALELKQARERGHAQMTSTNESHPFRLVTKTFLLSERDPVVAKQQILGYFYDTFDAFTDLYQTVREEHFWTRADPLRHPVGWYLAHCACFYANKLRVGGLTDVPFNDDFEAQFAIGVDEMSWDDKLQDRDDWPHAREIKQYRKDIRDFVSNIIINLPMKLPITWNSKWWIVLMGIEHERIHLETSTVLMRQLPLEAFDRGALEGSAWNNECDVGVFDNSSDFRPALGAPGHSVKNELIAVKASAGVEYGRKVDEVGGLPEYMAPVYGWDNEFGEAIVTDVPAFRASKYLVSNEEYYEFVLDGGYETQELWTQEGWRWVQYNDARYPKFWVHDDSAWKYFKYRTVYHEVDMPWDWPVITNNLEAQAFARWKARETGRPIRLPTEDEWFAIRKGFGFDANGDSALFREEQPTWAAAPGNVNLEYFTSEAPVNMFAFGETGLFDVVGNVWQHTLTPQHPFKGFAPHPFYDDFTVPCFGAEHNLLKGGSWVSTGNEALSFSRYQFRRHFFQFAGIRYVESDRDLAFLDVLADDSPYNSNEMIDLYTHFHYWDEKYFGVENFAKQVAAVAVKYMNPGMKSKALDLGCATGRVSFELARVFDHVTGIDFTARLIGVGYKLKEQGALEWRMRAQGDILDDFRVTLSDLGIDETIRDKVDFFQNDAQNLDAQFTGYDLVVASNLLDRLSNPTRFLSTIHQRINKNGKLIMLSPYTWLEQYTAKDQWIGGHYKKDANGKDVPVDTFDALKEILSEWFVFENAEYVEMVIRETGNKYQHTTSHCTVWTKK